VQPSVVQHIQAALGRIRTELKVGVIIVEQNIDFAWAFADQYIVLQRGRIVSQGATETTRAADISHLIHV
jgi:urea transport system ATP-binding protein